MLNLSVPSLYSPSFDQSWNKANLYNLAFWINGLAFKDIHLAQDGWPVIKIAELKSGISDQTSYTRQAFEEGYHVQSEDMLFAWSGSPDTSIDVFRWRGPEGWLNQHIFKVLPKRDVDDQYFYYLLRYLRPSFVEIARNKQTTGLGHVTVGDLKEITVALPTPNYQKAIAATLGALDDKIELNNRMNRTLEKIGQTLFRAWFVDFEPVRAKIEGRTPHGMDVETAALFPERLRLTDVGEIPDGWQVGTLGEVAMSVRAAVQPETLPPDTPYVGLEHMPRRSIALSEWGRAGDVGSGKSGFRAGDILFGKLRPYFHKVGVAVTDGVCSTDIVVIRPRQPEWLGFTLFHAASVDFVNYTDAHSAGTKMPRTNWQDMAHYEVVLPNEAVALAFDDIVRPLVERIQANVRQSRTLATLRDTLLPKLLSGELRVPMEESASAG